MSCAGVTYRILKDKFAFPESALFPYYSLMEAMKIEEMGTCNAEMAHPIAPSGCWHFRIMAFDNGTFDGRGSADNACFIGL